MDNHMPIYEYQTSSPDTACDACLIGFEVVQKIDAVPLSHCIHCGGNVKKIISFCHAAVIENSPAHLGAKQQIRTYEKSGMYSHAAELADSHAEKINDKRLKTRAFEYYKKAGYDL